MIHIYIIKTQIKISLQKTPNANPIHSDVIYKKSDNPEIFKVISVRINWTKKTTCQQNNLNTTNSDKEIKYLEFPLYYVNSYVNFDERGFSRYFNLEDNNFVTPPESPIPQLVIGTKKESTEKYTNPNQLEYSTGEENDDIYYHLLIGLY